MAHESSQPPHNRPTPSELATLMARATAVIGLAIVGGTPFALLDHETTKAVRNARCFGEMGYIGLNADRDVVSLMVPIGDCTVPVTEMGINEANDPNCATLAQQLLPYTTPYTQNPLEYTVGATEVLDISDDQTTDITKTTKISIPFAVIEDGASPELLDVERDRRSYTDTNFNCYIEVVSLH